MTLPLACFIQQEYFDLTIFFSHLHVGFFERGAAIASSSEKSVVIDTSLAPASPSASPTTTFTGRNILFRQAICNNYEGEGMEVDKFLDFS